MVTTIELHALQNALAASFRASQTSFVSVLLLTLVLADGFATLHGSGCVFRLLALATDADRDASWLPWTVGAIHAGLAICGVTGLGAGVPTIDAPEMLAWRMRPGAANEVVQPGASSVPPVVWLWAGILIASFLASIMLLSATVYPVTRVAKLFFLGASLTLPFAIAGLVTRGIVALRRLADPTIALGSAIGVGAVGLAVAFIRGVPLIVSEAETKLVEIEAAILFLTALLLIWSMRPRQRRVFNVVVDHPEDAPPRVGFNPFSFSARRPHFVSFATSLGQIAVFIRGAGERDWQLFDSSDSRRQLPVHEQELLIWNLTRLTREFGSTIVVRDPHGYFELSLEIGSLAVSSLLRSDSFNENAVTAAGNMLFQNADLRGLPRRAAGRAFARLLNERNGDQGSFSNELSRIEAVLDRAPTATTLIENVDLSSNQRAVDLSSDRLKAGVAAGNRYLADLERERGALRAVNNLASDAGSLLQDAWLYEIGEEMIAAGAPRDGDRTLDPGRAVQVLRLIGLRINRAQVTAIDRAARCEQRIEAVRAEVLALIDTAWRDDLAARTKVESDELTWDTTALTAPRIPAAVREAIIVNRSRLGNNRTNVPPTTIEHRMAEPQLDDDEESPN